MTLAHCHVAFGLFVCLAMSSDSPGANYYESASGDLSNDRLAPTQLVLDAPLNRISGQIQFGDFDYFTIHIPSGKALYALILESYVSENPRAFIGMQAGNTFTVDPDNASPTDLLGYTHISFDPSPPTDILDNLANAPFAIGFTRPLSAGQYTFWVNQTEPNLTDYRLRFVVPDPGDANLDGSVNFDDLLTLAQHYDQPGPHEWSAGDFNADGFVNFDDLLVLAQNYSGNDATLSFTPTLIDKWTLARSMVPEPTSLSAPLLLGVMTRRR